MKICVGGTFNRLHKGHRLILSKAFEYAGLNGKVYIGLATGDLVKDKINVKNIDTRKRKLEEYLIKNDFINKSVIVPITDKYGLTLEEDFDAIVISPETEKIAEEINQKRKLKGKKPLKIIKIPYVLADNGNPISSTRINKKEIDENGNLLNRD